MSNYKSPEQRAKECAEAFFLSEIKEGRIFTSMPNKYTVSIDSNDCALIYGEWDDGTKDFTGLGNIYKIMYSDLSTSNTELREALRELVREIESNKIDWLFKEAKMYRCLITPELFAKAKNLIND